MVVSTWGSPGGSDGKESACRAGDPGSISGPRRSPGGEHGYPLQCSCLENPMDGGTRWATVRGVAKSRTWLNGLSRNSSSVYICVCIYMCVCLCYFLDSSLSLLTPEFFLDFLSGSNSPQTWPLELGQNKCLLSWAIRWFVVVCYNCHGRVTQSYDFFHCIHFSVTFLMFRAVRI